MSVSIKTVLFVSLFIVLSVNSSAIAQTDTSATIELNIFPNPNRGTFYITLVKGEPQHSQLIGMDGRIVKTIYLQTGLNYVTIDAPAGIYILQLGDGEQLQQFKIIKK